MHNRLSAQFDNMKLATLAHLPLIGLTLALATGCHKGLDKTTHIPGQAPTAPKDTAAGIREPGTSGVVPPGPGTPATGGVGTEAGGVKGAGIPQAEGDFTGWTENREEFAAQTVHFDYDKSNVKPSEVKKLEEVARRMKSNFAGKALRIEGHCDERGTAEYNLALGERRSVAARAYLVSLGLPADRLRTVSYGKEFPFDPGHDESAFSKNRRAHFVITAK